MSNEWQRFKTTRMYLHPPKAERLITLWREGKLMLGEVELPITRPYRELTAAGIWFWWGDHQAADFREAEYVVSEDGIPIHGLLLKLGKLSAELSCVTDWCKCPTGYARLTLKNDTDVSVNEKIGFILRRGPEAELIFASPDVYRSYNPEIKTWFERENTWISDAILRDGEYFASCSDPAFVWDEKTGAAAAEIALAPGEERVVYFALGKGEYKAADFDEVCADTISRWEAELAKLTKVPDSIRSDAAKLRMVKNLTVQLLQCFSTGQGIDDLYSRQGGLQRRIWTYEAMPVLEALMRLGDYEEYVEPVIDLYFAQFQAPTGEMVPLGIHWAMATGTILFSFAKYAMVHGRDYWLRHRDAAMKSFEWIRETRRKSVYDGQVAPEDHARVESEYRLAPGLFPPMSSCDDPLVFQAWLTTDCNNVMGLEAFAEAATYFADDRAAEVKAEYDDYLGVIRACWEEYRDSQGETDELEIPYTPTGNYEEITKRFHFTVQMGFFANSLKPEPAEYEKIIRYYTRRGIFKGGLYDRMPSRDLNDPATYRPNYDDNGDSYVWYVCAHEYGWFKCFMKHGDLDRCREILRDAELCAMSDEYYMLERYHMRDPWYAPWSPNASCSGRMLNMLLDMAEL
ncbi:MAG: hypothetical protein E7463_08380 [Ruminococcaceae bacterium]|nr:hypothetical protein [Oscillospiraceae bacterium]